MPNSTFLTRDTFRERAEHNERLRTFATKVDHLIQTDPDGGFRACGPLLAEICREGVFTELANYELKRLLDEPNYVLEGSSNTDMLVWKSRFFSLVLKLATEPQRNDRLFGHPFDSILAPVSKQALCIKRYRQPKLEPNDVFDRTRVITFCGEETVSFGESIHFKAGEDIFLVTSKLADKEPPLLACVASVDKLAIRWEYDGATLLPVRAVASDTSASRLQFLAWMMSAMNSRNSLPALQALLAHPAHFVRWAAIQSIFRLDEQEGFACLRAALLDPHEHIRNAALRSLEKFGETREAHSSAPIQTGACAETRNQTIAC